MALVDDFHPDVFQAAVNDDSAGIDRLVEATSDADLYELAAAADRLAHRVALEIRLRRRFRR